ncbi:lamin tail domain-containing protein [Chishuiella changwenlii]|uniref:lamin tail domain-containing protein n=1 Tax=Chishuiella changwenlii TaxID=1434701 RepID=UPI002FDAF0E3
MATFVFPQVAITEVYYDTPFSETTTKSRTPFAGEYIELFNYTTEDIDIGGWRISDLRNSYVFPDATIIKSGDFLLLAYRSRDIHEALEYFNTTWSKAFFPTTVGQEHKILFQSNIVLNNYGEQISLYMNSIRGVTLNMPHLVHEVGWSFPNTTATGNKGKDNSYREYSINFYQTSGFNNGFDFYLNSFQLASQDQFTTNTYIKNKSELRAPMIRKATPLAFDIPFSLIRFEESPLIKNIWQLYEHFGYDQTLFNLLNTSCDKTIPLIGYNVPNDHYNESICFEYDEAGNYISTYNCFQTPPIIPQTNTEVKLLNREINYDDLFFVTPNSTTGIINISWDKSMENSLSKIYVVPFNDSKSIEVKFNNKEFTSYNLSSFPAGIYFVEFVLENGQIVSKKIIKI